MIKSKTITASNIELSIEIRLKDKTTQFVNQISDLKGVTSAVLVSYNGDYMG